MKLLAFYDSRSELGILESLKEASPDEVVLVDKLKTIHFDRYDALFVLGDRLHQIKHCYWALENNMPIIHHHAGDTEDSGIIDERVRWAISELADVLLPACSESRHNISFQRTLSNKPCPNFGSLAIDACKNVPRQRYQANYDTLVLCNPLQNETVRIDDRAFYGKKTLWIGCNPDRGRDEIHEYAREMAKRHDITFVDNLTRAEFLKVLADPHVTCVGNSSAFYIEGSYFKLKEEKRFIQVGRRNRTRHYGGYGDGNTAKKILDYVRGWLNG